MGESWIMCIELKNYWIPFAHVSLQSYHLLYHLNWSFIAHNRDLANWNMPPLALMPYHSMSVPKPFMLLEFNNLAIGHVVRTWNSPEGIRDGHLIDGSWPCTVSGTWPQKPSTADGINTTVWTHTKYGRICITYGDTGGLVSLVVAGTAHCCNSKFV